MTAAERERDEARIERDEARSVGDTLERQHQLAVNDSNEARAEVARLREALKQIADYPPSDLALSPVMGAIAALTVVQSMADEALRQCRERPALAPKETT